MDSTQKILSQSKLCIMCGYIQALPVKLEGSRILPKPEDVYRLSLQESSTSITINQPTTATSLPQSLAAAATSIYSHFHCHCCHFCCTILPLLAKATTAAHCFYCCCYPLLPLLLLLSCCSKPVCCHCVLTLLLLFYCCYCHYYYTSTKSTNETLRTNH